MGFNERKGEHFGCMGGVEGFRGMASGTFHASQPFPILQVLTSSKPMLSHKSPSSAWSESRLQNGTVGKVSQRQKAMFFLMGALRRAPDMSNAYVQLSALLTHQYILVYPRSR